MSLLAGNSIPCAYGECINTDGSGVIRFRESSVELVAVHPVRCYLWYDVIRRRERKIWNIHSISSRLVKPA